MQERGRGRGIVTSSHVFRYTETRRSRVICLCFYLFYIKFTKTEKCKLKKRSLNLSEDGVNVHVCKSRDSTRDVRGVASWAS